MSVIIYSHYFVHFFDGSFGTYDYMCIYYLVYDIVMLVLLESNCKVIIFPVRSLILLRSVLNMSLHVHIKYL